MEYTKYLKPIEELDNLKNSSDNKPDYLNDNEKIRKYRFFVKPGESAKVVFLHSFRFSIWEHQYKKGNDFHNYETCLKDIEGECPFCEIKNRPYVIGVSSVLNKYVDKDGNIKFFKKLICAKGDALDILKRRQNELGDLRGKVFEFYRSNKPKSNAVGTDIQYLKDIDLNSLKPYCPEGIDFEEWLKPFDYAEIFKPKPVAELKKILGMDIGVGEEESNGANIEDNLADLI